MVGGDRNGILLSSLLRRRQDIDDHGAAGTGEISGLANAQGEVIGIPAEGESLVFPRAGTDFPHESHHERAEGHVDTQAVRQAGIHPHLIVELRFGGIGKDFLQGIDTDPVVGQFIAQAHAPALVWLEDIDGVQVGVRPAQALPQPGDAARLPRRRPGRQDEDCGEE